MSDFYILDADHNLIATDVVTWAEWFNDPGNRRVAETELGNVLISTVCLGLDHNFFGLTPLLFETMVFVKDDGHETYRCSTWAQAEAQHAEVVAEFSAMLGGRTISAN
jgi:hypothetical protein